MLLHIYETFAVIKTADKTCYIYQAGLGYGMVWYGPRPSYMSHGSVNTERRRSCSSQIALQREKGRERASSGERNRMSFMKGDLMAKTRKLVKGLAKAEPVWLKAMEQSPPAVYPRIDGKIQQISFPEDVYVKKFFQTNPDSKHEDPVDISGFDPVPARIFGLRVLELKEQGVQEDDAVAVANLEYRAGRKEKKMAYTRLKQIAHIQGTKPPPNPYPSAIKEIQADERKYVRDRFFDPKILEIVKEMKATKETQIRDGLRPAGFTSLRPGGARGGGFHR